MSDPVLERYSVRKFKNKPVSEEAIQKLTAAFQASPCGMHQMDVMRGVIVSDEKLRAAIETASNNACYQAPLLFVLAAKHDSNFAERDASVAAENIMIEATSLGLGSVYVMGGAVALNKHQDILQQLDLPAGFDVETIVAIGKAAVEPNHEDRSQRYQLTRK